MKRLLTISAVMLSIAVTAGGCIQMSHMTGLPNPFDVDRPYEGRHRNPLAVRGITRAASLEVFPVANMPPGLGTRLAEELEFAAKARDIPIFVKTGAQTADQLMGRANIHETDGNLWLDVVWQYIDMDGTFLSGFTVREQLAARDTRDFEGHATAWDHLTPDRIDALAEQTADRLQGLLEIAQGRDPNRDIVRNRIILRAVTGAPGDGGRTLTTVLANLLSEAKYEVDTMWQTEDRQIPHGAVVVLGKVEISELENNIDRIDLIWSVFDHRGQRLGRIVQTNTVPRGRLDGSWGEIAVYAAQGAREGILGLLAHMPVAGAG